MDCVMQSLDIRSVRLYHLDVLIELKMSFFEKWQESYSLAREVVG